MRRVRQPLFGANAGVELRRSRRSRPTAAIPSDRGWGRSRPPPAPVCSQGCLPAEPIRMPTGVNRPRKRPGVCERAGRRGLTLQGVSVLRLDNGADALLFRCKTPRQPKLPGTSGEEPCASPRQGDRPPPRHPQASGTSCSEFGQDALELRLAVSSLLQDLAGGSAAFNAPEAGRRRSAVG